MACEKCSFTFHGVFLSFSNGLCGFIWVCGLVSLTSLSMDKIYNLLDVWVGSLDVAGSCRCGG